MALTAAPEALEAPPTAAAAAAAKAPEGVRVRIKRPQKRGSPGGDGNSLAGGMDAADAAAISDAMREDEPIALRRRDR